MVNALTQPLNESSSTAAEIDIRGRFLLMSCDMEFTLLNIIAFSAEDPNNQIRKFKDMKMYDKINNAIADLKNNKPNYYEEYKEQLDQLNEFREIRNDFAHCKMNFPDENNLKIFRILFVDDVGNDERLKEAVYTWEIYYEALHKFITLNRKLATLWLKLKTEYDLTHGEHPLVYPNVFDK